VYSQRCDGATTESVSWRMTEMGIWPATVDAPTAGCTSHEASAMPFGKV